MAYENKPGDISIFRNKSDNDKAPTMTGYALAHRDIRKGEKIEVAVWKRDPKSGGDSFLSGLISDPYEAQSNGPPPQSSGPRDDWLS